MTTYTYTTLDHPLGFNITEATGINAAGQIVGYYYSSSSGTANGFLYSGGMYTTLDDPLGVRGTFLHGINARGQIVGDYLDSSGVPHGFLYSRGSFTTLNEPLAVGYVTDANGINANGEIVGDYYNGGYHGFLYSDGKYTTLDDPLAPINNPHTTGGTLALGINDKGQIVGYYKDSSGTSHGFLYSGGTYTTFDDPLGGLCFNLGTFPNGINNNGQIVGYYGVYGANHGFLASPVNG